MTEALPLADRVAGLIHDVPDYPEPGVVFKDITPLLAHGPTFAEVVAHLAEQAPEVDVVVGMEAFCTCLDRCGQAVGEAANTMSVTSMT